MLTWLAVAIVIICFWFIPVFWLKNCKNRKFFLCWLYWFAWCISCETFDHANIISLQEMSRRLSTISATWRIS